MDPIEVEKHRKANLTSVDQHLNVGMINQDSGADLTPALFAEEQLRLPSLNHSIDISEL